jgi:hypothetical protein
MIFKKEGDGWHLVHEQNTEIRKSEPQTDGGTP